MSSSVVDPSRLAQLRRLLGTDTSQFDDGTIREALEQLNRTGVPLSILDTLEGPLPEASADLQALTAESARLEQAVSKTLSAVDSLLEPEPADSLDLAVALDQPDRLAAAHEVLGAEAPSWAQILLRARDAPKVARLAGEKLGAALNTPSKECRQGRFLSECIAREWPLATLVALLQAGADPNIASPRFPSGTICAIIRGREDLVRAILDQETAKIPVDLAARTPETQLTPLYTAVLLRRDALALVLLDAGSDPNVTYPWGHVLHLLADAPATKSDSVSQQDLALCRACCDAVESTQGLEARQAFLETRSGPALGGRTPFLQAVCLDRLGLAKALRAAGADPHARDADGNTALHLFFGPEGTAAASEDAVGMVTFLVGECGLDVNAQNMAAYPCTPLVLLLEALEAAPAWRATQAGAPAASAHPAPTDPATDPETRTLRACLAYLTSAVKGLDLEGARASSTLLRAIAQLATDPAATPQAAEPSPAQSTLTRKRVPSARSKPDRLHPPDPAPAAEGSPSAPVQATDTESDHLAAGSEDHDTGTEAEGSSPKLEPELADDLTF